MSNIPVYWWNSVPNFGDTLAIDLVIWLTGSPPIWSNCSPKHLTIGSIIPAAVAGDTVWGSGLLFPFRPNLEGINFRAVRGKRTRQLLGLTCPIGDPALLVPQLYPTAQAKNPCRVGLIPHHSECAAVKRRFAQSSAKVIDVAAPPRVVVEEILGCTAVLSASLHGLVVADAFKIPSTYVRFCVAQEIDFEQRGFGTYKYSDYYDANVLPRYILDEVDIASIASTAKCYEADVDRKQLLDAWVTA